MSADLDAVLAERGQRYGTFSGHALVAQALKDVIRCELGSRGKFLDPDQIEALEMIAHKIARIVNGDPDYIESWRDVAGYAQLVVNRLSVTDGATDAEVAQVVRKNGDWVRP